ncbi:MAG: YebC/PmpR family DNA-binding transcriptional regulator [Clostridia bacterium]|jgi:YebC/PmpR family DNA-binding regulatory protein|nr:YebC/PmpR family DNA-binding transcriptional regulator [Clostridia bacterium]MBQ6000203.1 YebC/PmpR family DNA-binding transcriptional regulator [Clostridia bacterium]
MSGHSKWKNIMHKKEKTDAQRAKIFTKIGREMSLCVKQGGPDPNVNSRLKDLIAKARANNVPMDNIERIIKKASGDGGANNYENITYEGYGPSGVAVIVEALTDNRNRTAGDMRHYFDKYGGNLGQTGSVSWMFASKGQLVVESEDLDADTVMLDALDAGASDFEDEGEIFTITTEPEDFSAVLEALTAKGYQFVEAEIGMVPSTYAKIEDEELVAKMEKLLDLLEDNDDVQNVYHNWDQD